MAMASANALCNKQQQKPYITTNLYELVRVVAEEVRPDEDGLVKLVVKQLLRDCQARFDGCRRT